MILRNAFADPMLRRSLGNPSRWMLACTWRSFHGNMDAVLPVPTQIKEKDDGSELEALKSRKFKEAILTSVRPVMTEKYPELFRDHFPSDRLDEPKLKLLGSLSGFSNVPTPDESSIVNLAEGVIASPKRRSLFRRSRPPTVTLLSKPMRPEDIKSVTRLVEKDIRIYRVIENSVDNVLSSVSSFLEETYRTRVRQPFREYLSHEKLIAPEERQETPVTDSLFAPEASNADASEVLLVCFSDGSVKIYVDMKPHLRLLPLPHFLGHKTASTMISVSLVVFGAVPLAYRSLKFAMDYPVLSELVAASVLATVSYGLWSTRTNSRTSQALAVCRALSERLVAQDEAAIAFLKEAAVEGMTNQLMEIHQQSRKGDYDATMTSKDLLAVAKEIGLAVEADDETGGMEGSVRWLSRESFCSSKGVVLPAKPVPSGEKPTLKS